MTKLAVPLLSQNDPRWKDITLGYNPPNKGWTIGNYGCLITCLSMYLTAIGQPTTPDILNKNLQDNNGFKEGTGLLVWPVFTSLYGLSQFYLSPRYEGPLTAFAYTKIRELLDNKMPVLTEIDFNPSQQGEQMHFIEIVAYDEAGNFYANDPWSGTYINVNVYGSMDTSVYQFRTYDKPVQGSTEVDNSVKAKAFDDVADLIGEPRTPSLVMEEIRKLISLEDILRTKEQQLTEVKTQAEGLKGEVAELKANNQTFSEQNIILTEKVRQNEIKIGTDGKKIEELEIKVEQLANVKSVDSFSGWELIGKGLQKVLRLG